MTNEMIRFLNDLKGNKEMVEDLYNKLQRIDNTEAIYKAIEMEGYHIGHEELLHTMKKFYDIKDKLDHGVDFTEADYELIACSYDEMGYPLGIFQGLGKTVAKALAIMAEYK